MAAEIALDRRQLTAARKAFASQIPKEIRNALNRELRTIGRAIAAEAVATARFSIDASTVKVRTSGPRIVIAVVKAEDKPHHGKAAAFENAGKDGTVRHPVFGHRDRWVPSANATGGGSTIAKPFLTPVADLHFVEAVTQIGEAVERAFRAAGFH